MARQLRDVFVVVWRGRRSALARAAEIADARNAISSGIKFQQPAMRILEPGATTYEL
jgi:hypothetical protein